MGRIFDPTSRFKLNITGRYRAGVSPAGLLIPDSQIFGPIDSYMYVGAEGRDARYLGSKANADIYAGRRALFRTDAVNTLLDMDFLNQVYGKNGSSYTLATLPGWSFSRSTASIAYNADGTAMSFDANVPCITDQGLYVSGSVTNLLPNSEDYTNTSYYTIDSSGGTSITASGITGPNGETTYRLQMGTGGTQIDRYIFTDSGLTPTSGGVMKPNTTYTFFLVARGYSGTTKFCQTFFINSPSVVDTAWYGPDQSVGTAFTRFKYTITTPNDGTLYYANISIDRASDLSATDLVIAEMMVVEGDVDINTPYVKTTSGPVTRDADVVSQTFSGTATSVSLTHTGGSSSPAASSPINLGASSGGAWVGKFIEQIQVIA